MVYNEKRDFNKSERENMKIELAGLLIEIEKAGEYTQNMCKNYIYTGENPADIFIKYDQSAIDNERKLYPNAADDYLQNLCIYRDICKQIIKFGAMLIHSAAIAVDGRGYMFSALSGTGKTTHINLWLKKFGERAKIINGDKPIIREVDGVFRVYGTPWCGKEGINENISVPVEGICLLSRGGENKIARVGNDEAISAIMEQTSRPEGAASMIELLDIIEKLLGKVPIYRLFCNMEPEAADVSYDGMCKN